MKVRSMKNNYTRFFKVILLSAVIIGGSLIDSAQAFAIPDVRFYGGNKIDLTDPDSKCENVDGLTGVSGKNVKEWIWSYLIGKGLTEDQAAGLMGNMQRESGFIPTRHQNKTLDVFNDRGDQGNAWGLVQWDGSRRYTEDLIKGHKGGVIGKLVTDKKHLEKYVAKHYDPVFFPTGNLSGEGYKNIPEDDLKELTVFELDYMYTESTTIRNAIGGGGKEWDVMKQQTSLEAATKFWMENFERPGEPHLEERIQFAKAAKAELSGLTTSLSGASQEACGGTETGSFDATLFSYAWNTHKGLDINPTAGWRKVIEEAPSKNRYIGGTLYPGIDCGGFVTNFLIDSGFEPNYNFAGDKSKNAGNTINQMIWLQSNWKQKGKGGSFDVASLKPGAVAINSTHTYVYVGTIRGYQTSEGPKDFESVVASASWDERAPMAGKETLADPDFIWYEKE
jgi:hypothetical protein